MTLGGFNYRCLMTALPSFLAGADVAGNPMTAGFLTTLILLAGGCLGQISGGLLADSLGARRIYLVLVSSLIPLSILLALFTGAILPALVAGFLAIGMFAQQPVENSLLAESTSHGRRSTTYGLKFVLTFGIGALGAEVVGMIWEEFAGLRPVFYVMAASAGLMTGLLLVFHWYSRQEPG